MRRATLAAVAVPVAVLAAAGCGGGSSPAATVSSTAASPSRSAPPLDGGTYTSTDAVLSALSAAGIACSAPEAVANATATGAVGMVDCDSPGGTGSDSVVVVFDTQTDAQGYAESMTGPGMGPLAAPAVVYGRDWAVNTTGAYAAQIQGALGGGVLAGPTPSAS
jgi:hypothetical protein